ncbi:Asp23/Gls24 family envelope stress response protein [Oenococcus sicerae]|uniref:Asp23/Gls24 family envelope stress response protein n=1 Tax=Oenococcus sicerae TaxID=2203724 RepID=A0AAJ1RCC7_9LACO|nr:Asp23/Gls24 family envelope stress response protein [Oenococcus sicerae]MDN6900345.1 Asp23/Gls24 family envelope stress response protein [Oenococcus sicerae]QAS69920.1 Asp23/Gls24 family envelope stress response protein [Oenococcus sicerae]
MSLKMKTKIGQVNIGDDVISTIVGTAASESFGVVGMASKSFKDGVNQVLQRPNYSRGILISEESDQLTIDVHIIVEYGAKLSEVSKAVQKQVRYSLEKNLGVLINQVNVTIEGIRA